MTKMGLDYEDLRHGEMDIKQMDSHLVCTMPHDFVSPSVFLISDNPGLVYCSVSGYGPKGPWSNLPGYDVVIAGTHGLMSITGSPDAPAKVGVALTDILTGTLAQGAILAALYDRQAHPEGVGQRVDCKYHSLF